MRILNNKIKKLLFILLIGCICSCKKDNITPVKYKKMGASIIINYETGKSDTTKVNF